MSHQPNNHSSRNDSKATYANRKSNRRPSEKKMDQQSSIASLSNRIITNNQKRESRSHYQKTSESIASKAPFMLDPANAKSLHLNLKTWLKNMQIHINRLYPELSMEILPNDQGERVRCIAPQPPEDPELGQGLTQVERNHASSTYQTMLTAYLADIKEFKRDKLKVIGEIREYVSTKIDEDIIRAHPQYGNTPDIIAILQTIEASYQILSIGGNIHYLQQQVELRDVHMFTGMAALDNSKRNQGKFDLHEHREEFQQLEQERSTCRLPVRSQQELARRFLLSLVHIARYKLMVNNFMENENDYDRMPKHTLEQIADANKFRKIPLNLSAAYQRASEQADLQLTFKDPTSYQSTFSSDEDEEPEATASYVNITNSTKNGGATKANKQKDKVNKPEEGKYCDIHNSTSHSTAECKSLPQLVLAWKQNPNNKPNQRTNKKVETNNTEDTEHREIRKSNVSRFLNDNYYDNLSDDEDIPIQRFTALQESSSLTETEHYTTLIDRDKFKCNHF